MEKHQAGDTVSVTFYRDQKQMTYKLIAGESAGVEQLELEIGQSVFGQQNGPHQYWRGRVN